jgi:hypothetical protein
LRLVGVHGGSIRALAVALVLVTAVSADGTALAARPTVHLIGDSLSRSAFLDHTLPRNWHVDAVNGRPFSRSLPLLQAAANAAPTCVVVALGTNDVRYWRSRSQMLNDLDRARRILRHVPCLLWTTVKVEGVAPRLNAHWSRYARMWNLAIRTVRGGVLDWATLSAGHPDWFLGDGIHLTARGREAYGAALARTLEYQL